MNEAELIQQLIIAGLEGDQRSIRHLAVIAARIIRKSDPQKAETIIKAIAHSDIGSSAMRALNVEPPPVDPDSRLSLVKIYTTPIHSKLILPKAIEAQINQFLTEHLSADVLLRSGLNPPTSLLLTGEPGVGKTSLAHYIAEKTKRQLIVLDLATSVSSLLGKTGQNLRAVLDYAREKPSVLFLDEFDSIAKRRDDPSDLGELKRIVNILLKELESWPHYSILVAATNNPSLLDKAVWRRFDTAIEIPLPGQHERRSLLEYKLKSKKSEAAFSEVLVKFTEGLSPADIVTYTDKVNRRLLLNKEDMHRAAFEELSHFIKGKPKKVAADFCRLAHQTIPNITYEQISSWVDLSPSTVHYHIKGKPHAD